MKHNKFISVVLSFILCFSVLVTPVATQAKGNSITVKYCKASVLNIRKKPKVKSKKIGEYKYRHKVKIIKKYKNKKWYKVKFKKKGKTKKGFVRKKYISKKRPKKRVLIGTFKITFYCPCYTCNGNTHRITASGARLKDGVTIATNRSEIPLGTKVYIEGYGNRIAQDTGAFGRRTIDMFVETSHRNLYSSKYGVKYKKIYKYK